MDNRLPPSELVGAALKEHVVPPLKAIGFSYTSKRREFTRKQGDFTYTFHLQMNRYNTRDEIDFWTIWGMHSTEINRWCTENELDPWEGDMLFGLSDWNIPGWKYPGGTPGCLSSHFGYFKPDNVAQVMQSLLLNATQTGIPHFDSLASWSTIADMLLKEEHSDHVLAADCLLLSGQPERSLKVLLEERERAHSKRFGQRAVELKRKRLNQRLEWHTKRLPPTRATL